MTLDDQGEAWETKKYAKAPGALMLRFFNAKQKNFKKIRDNFRKKRKLQQKNTTSSVKKILYDVKKKWRQSRN